MLGDQGTIRAFRVICDETVRRIGHNETEKRRRGEHCAASGFTRSQIKRNSDGSRCFQTGTQLRCNHGIDIEPGLHHGGHSAGETGQASDLERGRQHAQRASQR